MGNSNMDEAEQAEKALAGVSKYIDIFFDRAPVMMHSLNRGGRIVRVNRRWLQRLGYKRREVIGRMGVEFLTEESRVWAVRETLPFFWRVGSARSIGYQFVTNEGGVLDVLLDAEACPTTMGGLVSYAVLREGHDLTQWEQASTTMMVIQQLTHFRDNFQNGVAAGRIDSPEPVPGRHSSHRAIPLRKT